MVNRNSLNIDKFLYVLRHNWFYIPLALSIALILAMITIQKVGKNYKIEASLQIQDQSLSTHSGQQELFLKGAELFSSNTNVADEMGVITSLSTIAETLRDMNSHITVFTPHPGIFGIGTKYDELKVPPFQIKLKEGFPQVTNIPVKITFLNNGTYRVQATIEKGSLLFQSSTIDSKFDTSLDKTTIDKTLKLTQPYNDNYLNFSIDLQGNTPPSVTTEYSFVINEMRSLAESFRNKISVEPIFDGASILNISSSSSYPQQEIDFINNLMKTYIAKSLSKKNRLAQETIASIDKQLDIAVDTLSNIEGSLEDFRSKNEIIDIAKTSENLNEQYTDLNEKKSDFSVKIEYYQYLTNSLSNNVDIDEMKSVSTAGIEDPVLSNLLIELNALIRERSSIAFSSSKESPVLKGIDQRIKTSRSAVMNNVKSLLNSYTINLRNLEQRLNKINYQISQLPKGERNLTSIERNFSLNDDLYSYLLQKKAEANIAVATNVSDKTIIDEAHLAGNPFPKKTHLLLTFIILGFIASAGILFWRYITLSKIITENDIPAYIKWPVLDSRLHQASKKADPHSYKSLKVYNKLKEKAKANAKVISIVNSDKDDDAHSFIKELISQMIGMGNHIAIVHLTADLEGAIDSSKKSTDNINQDLFDVKQAKDISLHKLHINEVADKKPLQQLLFKLKENHDFVLILTPPLNGSLAYYKIREYFDFTLYLIHSGVTDTSALAEHYANLESDNSIGIVIMEQT
ncbi:GumC family protein [Zobellia nedashkovskayae]|uniref:GumC family protein n=1 Tax=Zobellia nedashkovskayae TaxID=2779510 RepID=UPI00188D29E4|nr:GNVR domain-containing protein [Zobellia nedashkovskayae]